MSMRRWRRSAERRARREAGAELEFDVRRISGRPVFVSHQAGATAAEREAGWKRVREFETAPSVTDRERLRRRGLEFPPARELDDRPLSEALGRLVDGLAGLGVYLLHTDHLSDRELYDRLAEAIDVPTRDLPDHMIVLDLLEVWLGKNAGLFYKYFASEEDRAEAQAAEPDLELPGREEPPYDRDRHLPWPARPTGPVMTFRRVDACPGSRREMLEAS